MNLNLFEQNIIPVQAENQPLSIPEKKIRKSRAKNQKKVQSTLLTKFIHNPIWLTMSESSKFGGVNNKTIRRAIQSKQLKYKIVGNRYFVDLTSLIHYLHSKTKLKNKLTSSGLGQYIKDWKD
jgi:hypothetical protein